MPDEHQHKPQASISPTFGLHGQLIFGEDQIYLSHLPMFMYDSERHPHNFQVILAVNLNDEARRIYIDDRRRNRDQRVYTVSPDRFDIKKLNVMTIEDKVGAESRRCLESFSGEIFRGHFERGGNVKIADGIFTVSKTITFREFDPEDKGLSDLKYLLFGRDDQIYMAHWITRPPDFDQILKVRLPGLQLKDWEWDAGLRASFPGRQNNKSSRLMEGEKAPAEIVVVGGHRVIEQEVEVDEEIYFEAGELEFFIKDGEEHGVAQ